MSSAKGRFTFPEIAPPLLRGCASSSLITLQRSFPRPTPRGVADVEDDNLGPFNSVENVVPKKADTGPTDAGHVGFLCGVRIVEQTRDTSIDTIGEGCGARRSVLK